MGLVITPDRTDAARLYLAARYADQRAHDRLQRAENRTCAIIVVATAIAIALIHAAA